MTTDVASILTADFNKNHQGRSYSLDHVLTTFDKYTEIGGRYFVSENVVIVYENKVEVCEFHCFSGGNGRDLTEAINLFLSSISIEYKRAVTYYDNPRINEISQYSLFPVSIQKIDAGEDKTYEMVFILGEPNGCGK